MGREGTNIEYPFRASANPRPEARILDPAVLRFAWSPDHPPRVTIDGECSYLAIRAACAFPLSDPEHFISLRDAGDKEFGLLRNLADLQAADQDGIRALLRNRYFIPVIRRVVSVKDSGGLSELRVETDRGPITFSVRSRHLQVAVLGPRRFIVTDLAGNRFEFVDWDKMDTASRKVVARFV
jgi:hypothetical protein